MKKACMLVAVAALMVAGCGGGKGSATPTATTPTVVAPGPSAAVTAHLAAIAAANNAASLAAMRNPAVKEAVAKCDAIIASYPELSATGKGHEYPVCHSAARFGPASVRRVAYGLCRALTSATEPSGTAILAKKLAACGTP